MSKYKNITKNKNTLGQVIRQSIDISEWAKLCRKVGTPGHNFKNIVERFIKKNDKG